MAGKESLEGDYTYNGDACNVVPVEKEYWACYRLRELGRQN